MLPHKPIWDKIRKKVKGQNSKVKVKIYKFLILDFNFVLVVQWIEHLVAVQAVGSSTLPEDARRGRIAD